MTGKVFENMPQEDLEGFAGDMDTLQRVIKLTPEILASAAIEAFKEVALGFIFLLRRS